MFACGWGVDIYGSVSSRAGMRVCCGDVPSAVAFKVRKRGLQREDPSWTNRVKFSGETEGQMGHG